ncbi:pilus assembly PilX family protein [Ectothiorhodospira variabilis]|uniref:pilus assembly PilX family protein n=1 Tax=Ectothiorhodospira variabilis TaxID=505694 RepID=UPI001EFB6576|nr:PilX N-terminal domain-containing pilus assembly protein [Ectothiorhodospira variabilis]MCG5493542.1 PilX N-terminal domain-containing pilus assembly protein [Ectothiorhodospira variabilis]MCG5502871.1 PilX N-terminal domain-containing pilus assembly protein [Ectothiorhodospira variabilis]MCG5506341.1 PilX N-terminal domain-containing pilus assembly protein [Ectothiorhodospira variabilis]
MKHQAFPTPSSRARIRKESGVALVVALVMLVLVTLVGLSSIQGVNLQERMTSNQQERNVAFQRAETALRVAEELVLDSGTVFADLNAPDCSSSSGISCPPTPVGAFTASGGWTTLSQSQSPSGAHVGTRPQYFIEDLGDTTIDEEAPQRRGSASGGQYGSRDNTAAAADRAYFFRITARNRDPEGDGDALVVLQSVVRVVR